VGGELNERCGHRILLDTNILIGVLNGTLDPRRIARRGIVVLSAVTVMEIYALAGMSDIEQHRIDSALAMVEVMPVDVVVAKRAGMLARTRPRRKSDLLIAATAIVHGLPMITKNIRDFREIPGLALLSA